MEVEDPVRRQVEDLRGDDLPEVGEDPQVRPEVADRRHAARRPDPLRLEERKPEPARLGGDRHRRERAARGRTGGPAA